MKKDEIRLEPLGGGIRIYVNSDYRFGTDAVLLADFAAPRVRESAADLGCGGGIIPLLWCKQPLQEPILGIDIQNDACHLAEQSAAESGVADRVRFLTLDLRNIRTLKNGGSFDVVTCNPPYRTGGGGIVNPGDARAIARHEITCTLKDVVTAAAYLLKSGGRFCLCQRPERLCDVLLAMRAGGVEPKRLRLVCQRPGAEPWLFLIEGKRGARAGMRVLPMLYLEENGRSSPEMEQIYGDYREAGAAAYQGCPDFEEK